MKKEKPASGPARTRVRKVDAGIPEHVRVQDRKEERRQILASRKAAFLQALSARAGIISGALKATSTIRRDYEYWYAADLDFRAEVEDIMSAQVDSVESRLLMKIRDGDTKAIMFYLSCKGQRNGYSPNAYRHHLANPVPQEEEKPVSADMRSEIIQDRTELDDNALVEAMRIANSRVPGLFEVKLGASGKPEPEDEDDE